MNVIEISGLMKTYKNFALQIESFSVPKGCVVGVVGENGAGKSTLIKLIMNSISKEAGTINIFGIDNESAGFTKVKNEIGFGLDECHYHEDFNAKNINAVMKQCYINWQETTFLKYIELLKLSTTKKIKDYSRGMKMKLGLAVALSHNAKLLVLDEVTSGLDPVARENILEIISDFTMNETNSVIMSSHILSDLEKVCDYIAFVSKGKLVFFEEKDLLIEKYGIVNLKKEEIDSINIDAIIRKRENKYSTELLVLKELVPKDFIYEKTNLEDIVIFLSKEE